MATCIWCLEENARPSVEHIFPEALGCPKGFVLTGGIVCKSCNNGLAHLDQAVADDFDMFAFMANVPKKGGRPPAIKGRGNLIATKEVEGPAISVNMDPQARIAHDGSVLGPYGKSKRNVKATFKRNGNIASVNYSMTIGENPKFARGITKIAFSTFTYFQGPESALSEKFSPIRTFVRDGVGQRPVMMKVGNDTSYFNQAWPPYISENSEFVTVFRLAVFEFVVDLSPAYSQMETLKKKAFEMYGDKGWTWIPNAGA